MKKNVGVTRARGNSPTNHEGVPAERLSLLKQLRRSVLACLLWEDTFYEAGEDIAARIKRLVALCDPFEVAKLAITAREEYKLRHVPLLLVRELARHPERENHTGLVRLTLERVIQRADELAEFLAIYWADGKQPIASAVKKGLAAAFAKFNEYDLAKYNRDAKVKLRDVLFLTHAKPPHGSGALYKRLVEGELKTPDTWEVLISAAKGDEAESKRVWTDLLSRSKLGALALLRNLRNMTQVGVDPEEIRQAIALMNVERVLPFRFITAARYAPQFEDVLEARMLDALEKAVKLPGETVLLVDISPSMVAPISSKSDLTRIDAACALAILCREICERVTVLSFSNSVCVVPPRRGFALRDAIVSSQESNGTLLGRAVQYVNSRHAGARRLIVITDEQSQDKVPSPTIPGYMLNVAAYQNGVSSGAWMRIDGWSEATVQYIQTLEQELVIG